MQTAFPYWVKELAPRIGSFEGFAIYMPNLVSTNTTRQVSAFGFSKWGRKMKVNMVFGGEGSGRATGGGLIFKGQNSPDQVWRVDIHPHHVYRTPPPRELNYWTDPFLHIAHYHVNKSGVH